MKRSIAKFGVFSIETKFELLASGVSLLGLCGDYPI
jgi:hypothetical protein